MKTKITVIILILSLTLSFVLSGCTDDVKNLSDKVEPDTYVLYDDIFMADDYADFAVKLFDECFKGEENTLVSPLSIALALAMVAEGANNVTLEEIKSTIGMDVEDLRKLAFSYLNSDEQLRVANSLWINDIDSFEVNKSFLQENSAYHNADVFEVPFSTKAVKEINSWVSDKTDGMIDSIINELDPQAVMCLVNALLFDSKWEEVYDEHQVDDGVFVTENGETLPVKYMCSSESSYIKDENGAGFVKYYEGREYAFMALLPDEGVSVEEYVSTLDGEKLASLLENIQDTTVYTKLPKFESEFSASLKEILISMGMEKAFDKNKADFSKLGTVADGNIWIGDVAHKTKITVAEQGTKAGAATAVVFYGAGASSEQEEPKEVYLERPFVYMIVDMENNIPIFMGTLMSVE